MEQQKLWRGTLMITEQINGYYTVRINERWDRGALREDAVYENLTWWEARDCVSANLEILDETRLIEHRAVVLRYGVQGDLF